jgi:hypothetical protein
MGDGLRFDSSAVWAAVDRELSSSRPIWDGRKLLDSADGGDEQYWHLDEVLKDRASKSIEHVFSLLALELPAGPLKVAFRALHSEDRLLRGLALEYLETTMPPRRVRQLAKLVDPAPAAAAPRPRVLVLDELMASQQSILTSLRIPSGDVPGGEALRRRATQG